MKKILLLGGSAQQVVAIETAKKLGYYTVLCDYLKDNPGQFVADKFYLESTTDREKILSIAKAEAVDGIIAYASDPAAPTAAYVAESMGLPTNSYKSVETLCNKEKFRAFLNENGFNSPDSYWYDNKDEAIKHSAEFDYPVMVKPVDSSGSKGVSIVKDENAILKAVEVAFSFSRSKRIIIEKYVEKCHDYLIGGDIFISNGRVIAWGLLNCHRDNSVNPLVPVGKSYPLCLSNEQEKSVKKTVQDIIAKLGLKFGLINVELIIDKSGSVWPIDIGPRAGGNMIPDLMGLIFNADFVKMAVQAAMGITFDEAELRGSGCFASHNLHCSERGNFKEIEFRDTLKKHIVEEHMFVKPNDEVYPFDFSSRLLGIILMKFSNKEEMFVTLNGINDLYGVKLY